MSRVVDKDQEEYKRLQKEIKQAFREMIGLKEGEVVQDEQEVAERVLKVHQKAAVSTERVGKKPEKGTKKVKSDT
jgi:hypothetical protein